MDGEETARAPKLFSGPVIDRDVFGPGLPHTYRSAVPYFYVRRDRDPMGQKFRFWFEPARGGWVWDAKSA